MAFNSFVFLLIFVPLVVSGYWILASRQTARLAWLVAASLIFYAYADWRHMLLLVALTALGYLTGLRLFRATAARERRFWLGVSIAIFLAPLGFFKYFDFAAGTAQSILSILWPESEIPLLRLSLPLGISFYTFKALSYCLDVHNHRTDPAPTLLHFAAYVTLFPQLVAGPLSRYTDLGRQLATPPCRPGDTQFLAGIYLLIFGLAKKVLIADRLAAFVTPLLAGQGEPGFFTAWGSVLGYAMQLYFDFSGYSDMAVGIGHLLGLDLPRNFDYPYRAENIGAFWNRWHITLSHWFREYVFFPLSRGLLQRTNRRYPALVRTAAHLVTMGLVGLWHGAAWTFILWGVYHGVLLAVYAWLRERHYTLPVRWLNRVATFALVMAGWAIFASPSVPQAANLLAGMAGLRGFESIGALPDVLGLRLIGLIAAGLGIVWICPDTWEIPRSMGALARTALGVLLFVSLLAMGETVTFLYRQF